MFNFFKNRRRKELLDASLPDEWRATIDQNVAVFARLSRAEQERLLQAAKIIACERSFYGVGNFKVTDDVAVTIAAQAALLVLDGDDYYFERVRAILVHASHAHVRMVHPLGGIELVEEGVAIAGQLLEQGEVRLAWDQVLESGLDACDGFNVVLHEFAHHLDWLDGAVDGMPPLRNSKEYRYWARVFDDELMQIGSDQRAGRDTLLPNHAADNRAELFAYGTECFFERPLELEELHPELFECLRGFYKTDPRQWFPDGETARRGNRER